MDASNEITAEEYLESFFRWRSEWRVESSVLPHHPSLEVAVRYILAFCIKRFAGLGGFCRDLGNRDEALHVVRLTLLDPALLYSYQGVARGIVFFGLRAKAELNRLLGDCELESLEALQTKGYEPTTPAAESEELPAILLFTAWCQGDIAQRKWSTGSGSTPPAAT